MDAHHESDARDKLVSMAYRDLAQPAAREVGQAIAGAVRVALSPANFAVWSFEQAKAYAEGRVAEILERRGVPPARVQPPRPELAAPAIAALRLPGQSDDLRSLYLGLLASAMDAQTASSAHPSFVEIIRQLTPDEARVVRLFTRVEASGEPSGFPCVDVVAHLGEESGFVYLLTGCTTLGEDAGCGGHLPGSSLVNLERLGLVSVRRDQRLAEHDAYKALLQTPTVQDAKRLAESRPGARAEVRSHLVVVTDFGLQFALACTDEISCIGIPARQANDAPSA
jgi:hypothetical protein